MTITPTCKKTERRHLVPLETQTAGSLREHKDGGLLDRKAVGLGLQSPEVQEGPRTSPSKVVVLFRQRARGQGRRGKRETEAVSLVYAHLAWHIALSC